MKMATTTEYTSKAFRRISVVACVKVQNICSFSVTIFICHMSLMTDVKRYSVQHQTQHMMYYSLLTLYRRVGGERTDRGLDIKPYLLDGWT